MCPTGVNQRPRSTDSGSPARWFLVITGVAFLLRLIHLLQLRHNYPLFLSPQMDALYHHEWALAIATGKQFIADAFFRAPLYPYFLGLLYKLFGTNQMAVKVVQALIGSAGCGLVYLLARRLLADPEAPSLKPQAPNPRSGTHHSSLITHHAAAVIAGLTMAAYPLAIWYDGELLFEGLLAFLLVLGFVLLLRSRDTDRQWWLPGIVFGLAALTRPNVLAFVALLPAWLLLEYRRGAWKRLAQVWGAAAIIILPVTIRNYAVSGQFVPIAWQAGTNFAIGNNPESDGVTAVVPGTRGSWWGGYDDVKRLAEEAEGRPLKGAEIDRYWMAKGFEFWRKEPGRALGLLLRKTYLWFGGYEVRNESDLYVVKRYSFINYLFFQTRFLKFPFGVLLPLALAGVWFSRRQWRRFLPVYLFIGAYSLSFIVFFVTARFRIPMVPLVAILAAIGLKGLIRRDRPSKMGTVPRSGRSEGLSPFSDTDRVPSTAKRDRGVALAIALVAFLLLNSNLVGAGRAARARPDQAHVAAALGLHSQGRDVEALAEVRKALDYDSAANALLLEAYLHASGGRFADAERAARAAVRLHPDEANAYGGLGNVFMQAGELDSAAHYLEVALQRDPNSLRVWDDLGNVALKRGDYERARYYYEGALKIRPTYTSALYNLGLCDYNEGKVAEAHARWQQVLKLDPAFAPARQALEQLK